MADRRIDDQLYQALKNNKKDVVIDCCKELKDGPLRVINIHKDTVLHVALRWTRVDMVDDLLALIPQLPGNLAKKMTEMKNNEGHTILHAAATYDTLVPAAESMLKMAPNLLLEDSQKGEKATFRAARYGQTQMFKFLEDKFKQHLKTEQAKADAGDEQAKANAADDSYIKRKDVKHFCTVLQVAVVSEEFELALYIANRYPHLIEVKDKDGYTPLLILAHKPRAFSIWGCEWLKQLFNCFSAEDEADASKDAASSWIHVPWWEELKRERKRYKLAVKLTNVLVEKDSSWKATEPVEESKVSTTQEAAVSSEESEPGPSAVRGGSGTEEKKNKEIQETPLFEAAKYGIVEIVDQVLDSYPQALEGIDDEGRTILHIAVKYRRKKIIEKVKESGIPLGSILKKLDKNSNSVLHMIGEKKDIEYQFTADAAMRSPVFQLQDDLLLYESIEKNQAVDIFKNNNSEGYSADDLFVMSSKELRDEAQEWMKKTAENCSIVAVLIATVAFAAAYTVPGGPDNSGIPILLNRPLFLLFTVADVLSLTLALTSVASFLSIFTSSYHLNDFKQSLPLQLMVGITFLNLSMAMMMLALAATIILMINNRQSWTNIAVYTVVSLPVTALIIVSRPLYLSHTETLKYTLKKIGSFFPQFCDKRRRPESTRSQSTKISIEIQGQSAT